MTARFHGPRIFDCEIPLREWSEFSAEGQPLASGVVFAPGDASSGVPLGGIGTGATDWNLDGTLGRTTIFNSFTPPREQRIPVFFVETPARAFALGSGKLSGWARPRGIRYWGHYPVADMEFDLPGSVQVGVRAWAPFVPASSDASNTPAAEFSVRIRNLAPTTARITLTVQIPGPSSEEARKQTFPRRRIRQCWQIGSPSGVHHAVRIEGGRVSEAGGSLPEDFRPGSSLPGALRSDSGFSAKIEIDIAAEDSAEVRITWGWFAPVWRPSFYREYRQYYTRRFEGAVAAIRFLGANRDGMLARILAWQSSIYAHRDWPAWLRDQLVNIVHTLAKDSFWAAERVPPDSWYGEMGIFGLSESPRSVPHVAIPSDFYGSLPLALYFPDLLRQMLRAYAHFQLNNGEIPLGLGWGSDLGSPIYGFLHTTNAATFVDLVHRLDLVAPDAAAEFQPAVKMAIEYLLNLDRDGDGLPDLDPQPTGNQFYGAWHWEGTATHPNGFFLGALGMAAKFAHKSDPAFAARCRRAFKKGAAQLEKKLWGGDNYRLYHDTATGRRSDTVLANQLVGHLLARTHGLPSPFPAARVKKTIQTIRRLHLRKHPHGIRNAIRPDGTVDRTGPRHSTHMFTGEAILVSATLLWEGAVDDGLALAGSVMHNLVIRQGRAWDPPNEVNPQSGKPTFGTDFYQMMVLWFLPLALDKHTIGNAAQRFSSGVAR